MVHLDDFTVREFKDLVELLRRYDALMYTETLAASYIEKAKAALHVFSASATKDTLLDLADYALRRHH
jgi:octaprenyl-diphosphate synthase